MTSPVSVTHESHLSLCTCSVRSHEFMHWLKGHWATIWNNWCKKKHFTHLLKNYWNFDFYSSQSTVVSDWAPPTDRRSRFVEFCSCCIDLFFLLSAHFIFDKSSLPIVFVSLNLTFSVPSFSPTLLRKIPHSKKQNICSYLCFASRGGPGVKQKSKHLLFHS